MITAIVLVKTSVDQIPEIAEAIAAIDGVSEVYSVTGGYDLVAMVRVRRHDDLAEVIPGRLNKVPGSPTPRPRSPSGRTRSTTWRPPSRSAWTADSSNVECRPRNGRLRCGSSTARRR